MTATVLDHHEVASLAELESLASCPACGAHELTRVEPTLAQRMLMWGAAPPNAFRRSRSCKACGTTVGVVR